MLSLDDNYFAKTLFQKHNKSTWIFKIDKNTSIISVAGGNAPSAIPQGVIAKKTVLPHVTEPSGTVVPVGHNRKQDEEFVDTMPTQSNSRTTVANSRNFMLFDNW